MGDEHLPIFNSCFMKFLFRINRVMKLWDPSWGLWQWQSKFNYIPLVRTEYVFALQIWCSKVCVKNPIKGRQKALFSFLFFLTFFQKSFLKIWANHFSLLIFISFKPSLPLLLTIERKRWLDLFFSMPAWFEQLPS